MQNLLYRYNVVKRRFDLCWMAANGRHYLFIYLL